MDPVTRILEAESQREVIRTWIAFFALQVGVVALAWATPAVEGMEVLWLGAILLVTNAGGMIICGQTIWEVYFASESAETTR